MKLKKLPIGIQTFSKIREGDYVYVDKTGIALELLENYQYVFLSRPRRFGKSLFLDTLRNIFEANKSLFSGLAIENQWNWDIRYPVIRISFAQGKIESRQQLDESILRTLKENQQYLAIECEEKTSVAGCFSELIRKANQKYNQKVVVLVDEYDKPILDNITNTPLAQELRDGLVNFYSVIKGSDEFLRFAFLTGVSKFTKTSIFSGLNNITDISLDKPYGDICGYSQQDVETTFAPYLEGVDMDRLKEWYNGYNFLGSRMYNPFDILSFIAKDHTYSNYWFESGTPTFLIELIKKHQYFLPNLANLRVDQKLLNSFDIENLDLEVILYQSGYLTIGNVTQDEDDDIIYTLVVPNKEVKTSLNKYIITTLYEDNSLKAKPLSRALREQNLESFKLALTSIFSSIPYNHFTKNDIQHYEGFYASVIYVYLQSLGLNIIGEDVTNKGRIDLTIKMANAIYILEFKVDATDKTHALQQIKDKGYADKYLNEQKPIYLIGIHFAPNAKNLSSFEWERLNSMCNS
ncbi:ATP-binding protein [Thiomicrospira microaerophila]|uniref:ATP-binding protein n=1 Tax=Thiomicrospira microaerophila TaxID=406020 RepID=UPI0005CA3CAD|nr:ATP-binding protein [Thiomicrospira microaerophila]